MKRIVSLLDRWLYPDFKDNWDDWLFRDEICKRLSADSQVLDLGAGAGIVAQMRFRGRVAIVCGVDPDPSVLENPFLDDAHIGVGESIPYQDQSFNVVFADNVLEHLENPVAVFAEVCRVLKPGGWFLVKTPNRWHYVPLIASLTPHWFHSMINGWRGRKAEDVFPTRYLANSPRDVRRLAAQAGLDVVDVLLVEGRPEYLRMTAPTYIAGWIYERFVNLTPITKPFRVLMIAVMRKPDNNSSELSTDPACRAA